MSHWMSFLIDALALSATFIYGATGEIITEKAGHLNLGIPGIMCMGAAGGCLSLCLAVGWSFPPYLMVSFVIFGAFLTGWLMGLFYSFFAVTLRANQNVTGLTMTIFGVSFMKVIMRDMVKTTKAVQALALQMTGGIVKKKMPLEDAYSAILRNNEFHFRFPFAGRSDALNKIGVMFFLAIVIAVLASLILTRTRVGLSLRSVGENPATADAAGVNVIRYKYLATCIGSGIAGMGGLYYIIDYMTGSSQAYNTVESLGWLSVALVIFVLWKPWMTIPSGFVFSVLFLFNMHTSLVFSGRAHLAYNDIFKMLPYVFTIVVLIISSIRNKRENQPPASLGLSYFREER